MAYHDTLFQLGMDLTRSSPAQKEDHGVVARVAHNAAFVPGRHGESKNFCIERDGVRFAGNQLIVDLFGASRLDDIEHIERTLKRCVEVAGATLLHVHLHHDAVNGGISGVAVLAGSHVGIHCWPSTGFAAVDMFMSGNAKPQLAVAVLRDAFKAREVVVKTQRRGEEVRGQSWQHEDAAIGKKQPQRLKAVRKAKAA